MSPNTKSPFIGNGFGSHQLATSEGELCYLLDVTKLEAGQSEMPPVWLDRQRVQQDTSEVPVYELRTIG